MHKILELSQVSNSSESEVEEIIWHEWTSGFDRYSPLFFFRSMTILYFTNFVFSLLRFYNVIDWTVERLGVFSRVGFVVFYGPN